MFYRIRIDLAFKDTPPPGQIKSLASTLLRQAMTVNPGQVNEERGFIIIEKCYHDQNPALPCEVIELLETTP